MKQLPDENKIVSLDDMYHMVTRIYSDKNVERPLSVTFGHFVEVCGMLTIHDRRKNRNDFTLEDALCKALGWYFPLLAKLRVRSVQELIYRKYPYACPYCRLRVHQESECKLAKGTAGTVNHKELRALYTKNKNLMPKNLNSWQQMFGTIYPRELRDTVWSTIALFEELGELAEAIRVFEAHPKYFAGEAADVFSYIMGIATEHSLRLQSENKPPFDFEREFLERYPGLCPQCGHEICICPAIPDATVGRMAKELDLFANDDLFTFIPEEFEARAAVAAMKVRERSGGLVQILKRYPFDRGEVNRALLVLCMKLADLIGNSNPSAARAIQEAATEIAEHVSRPGTRSNGAGMAGLISILKPVWSEIGLSIGLADNTLASTLGRQFQSQSCKIGVVTALPKEFAAMRSMFDNSVERPIIDDPNDYVIGEIAARDGTGKHLVVLTLLKEMGNNSAAAAAANLLRSFQGVEDVLMVGIAGGIPCPSKVDKHVRLGDIVISNREGVLQYDNLTRTTKVIKLRGTSAKPSARLIGKVNMLEAERLDGKYPWEVLITRGEKLENGKRPAATTDVLREFSGKKPKVVQHPSDPNRRKGMPRLHYGRVGASNTLLKDPRLRDELGAQHNVLAIEMEGSGIADGTWTAGQHYLLIRGICDYCDSDKNDAWQGYAAVVAAAFARSLVASLPVIGASEDH